MENEILEYIKIKYKPEIVLLIGSRASGDYRAKSDWDFYVFTNDVSVENNVESLEGEILDVSVKHLPIQNDFILKSAWAPIKDIRLILDNKENLGAGIKERSIEAYNAGPAPLNSFEVENRQRRARRLIQKADNRSDDIFYVNYHLGEFYQIALRYWFELRNEWTMQVYNAVPYIKEKDLRFYQNIERLITESLSEKKIRISKEIYFLLFDREM